jgi:hypothetical protein
MIAPEQFALLGLGAPSSVETLAEPPQARANPKPNPTAAHSRETRTSASLHGSASLGQSARLLAHHCP